MSTVYNTFDGGTDGTTISTANSGGISGNAFNAILGPVAAGFLRYSIAKIYGGGCSMQVGTRGTAGQSGVTWTTTALGTLPADSYQRFLINTDVLPAANGNICLLETAAPAGMGSVRLLSTGALDIHKADGSLAIAGSFLLVPNKWYIISVKCHGDAATGYVGVRIYDVLDAPIGSYAEQINWTGGVTWAMPANPVGKVHFGCIDPLANWPSATQFVHFDSLYAGALSEVGPVGRYKIPIYPQLALAPTRSF